MTSAVIVSLRVPANAEDAFAAFTEEIGVWWRTSPLFQLTPEGDGALYFEPGEGGRLMTRLPSGKQYEIGKVICWRPGERLCFDWRPSTFAAGEKTEVEVRFEAFGDETRVTVEHRGWDSIPQAHVARHGFPLHATQARLGEHWRGLLLRFFDVCESEL